MYLSSSLSGNPNLKKPPSGCFLKDCADTRLAQTKDSLGELFLEEPDCTMGAYLDKPILDKYEDSGEANGLRYGLSSMQGWRTEMEDAHTIKTDLGRKGWSYFAIFDGHSGKKAAEHSAEHLLSTIMSTNKFKRDIKAGIREGFLELDRNMSNCLELEGVPMKSGTTAVCAFVTPDEIIIANCGDSRALLCRQGQPFFGTLDHKPSTVKERERIVNAGGRVMMRRVNGCLAVSRTLGDFDYKDSSCADQCEQVVSPEPDVTGLTRDHDQDEFLVLACDGIWDQMDNAEMCDYVRSRLRVTDDLREVAKQVLDTCLYRGSKDNMSLILVVFPAAPKPCPEAILAEKQLDDRIEELMKEIMSNNEKEEFRFEHLIESLFNLNFEEKIPGLPPGGGLHSKQSYIAELYRKLYPDSAETITKPYVYSVVERSDQWADDTI